MQPDDLHRAGAFDRARLNSAAVSGWAEVGGPRAAYDRTPLDRMAAARETTGFVFRMLDVASARVLPMADGDIFLDAQGQPVWLRAGSVAAKAIGALIFLGCADGAPRFAIDAQALGEEVSFDHSGTATAAVRSLANRLPHDDLAVLGYAKGLLHWHAQQRFCGRCGGPTESAAAGHQRRCTVCGTVLFPRIEPAVIVLVEDPMAERCLLVRHAKHDAFSTLAGFVEIGERLEEAVRREVEEEAGVAIDAVRFIGSQAWPFPAGLMVAFRARARLGAVTPDGNEVTEARWVTRKEVKALFFEAAEGHGRSRLSPDSLEHKLIEDWLAER